MNTTKQGLTGPGGIMKKLFILSIMAFSFAAYAGEYSYLYTGYDCEKCSLEKGTDPGIEVTAPSCVDPALSTHVKLNAKDQKHASVKFNKICIKLPEIKLKDCNCRLIRELKGTNNNNYTTLQTAKVICHPTQAVLYDETLKENNNNNNSFVSIGACGYASKQNNNNYNNVNNNNN